MKLPSLEGAYKFLGDNPNSAVWVACTIATFKAIFRPMFTMMDKKSDHDTKKFAAIRELLTEAIALPIYAVGPALVTKALMKTIYKNEKSPLVQKTIKANTKFLTVCAATAIIPAVCNLVQPPIMAAYKKSQDAKKAKAGLDVTSNSNIQAPTTINKPVSPVNSTLQNPLVSNNVNSGMRVGN